MKYFFLPITLICFLLLTGQCAAQVNFIYIPLKDDDALKSSQFSLLQERYNADVANISSPYKKDIEKLYKERYESIKEYFDDSMMIADREINNYLQSIMTEIIKYNPALQKLNARALFCRAWWPNASCYGEGTILFNIGLFTRLDNESEMAFVLCHELAHQYFDHSNNAINHYTETINSKEFQQQLKNIKNAEFEQRKQLEALLKNISFSGRRHSREYESQADSMALIWMGKTRFTTSGAAACLALLDSADKDKYNIDPNLQTVFNFPEYPFQQSWVAGENSFFTKLANAQKEENKALEDSLKTHPDCLKRIALLQKEFPDTLKRGSDFVVYDTAQFKALQTRFDYEILEYTFHHTNVSRSLYYTLQMMQYLPPDAYLASNTGRCLNLMYQSQKDHVLGRIIDLPSPANEKKYNNFLNFLQQLRLTDISSLSYYYMRRESGDFGKDKLFLQIFADSRKIFDN